MSFFIRTKLNNVYRSIDLSNEEAENKETLVETIITKGKRIFNFFKVKTLIEFFLALTKHGVCTDKELEVDLVDEYQMSIDDENVGIVLQYKHCSHFFVELLMDYQHKQIPILIEVSLF